MKKPHLLMEERIGERWLTNEGYWVEIIECFGWNNITIRFDNGVIHKGLQYSNIKGGNIKNPYHPSVCGVGYIGDGKYEASKNRKSTKVYNTWQGMLSRCYSQKMHSKRPTYKEVVVCEKWHNFQNFAKWYEENYKDNCALDKDILFKGNKIYSSETCCFVPSEINGLFIKKDSNRGEYPIGVCFSKALGKFKAGLQMNNKCKHLGFFETVQEAFQAYKTAKENYIKEVAERYKDQIAPQTYQALINYKVEITD